MTTRTTLPGTITAGDSVAVTLTLADYPTSAGWSLTWTIAGTTSLSVTSAPVDGAHTLTMTGTQTAGLVPGLYRQTVRATLGSVIETLATSRVTIAPDLARLGPDEATSYAERMLALCQTARENILKGEMKMYMIGGRQVMLHTLEDLAKEEARWRARLDVERSGTFGAPVRFDVVWR